MSTLRPWNTTNTARKQSPNQKASCSPWSDSLRVKWPKITTDQLTPRPHCRNQAPPLPRVTEPTMNNEHAPKPLGDHLTLYTLPQTAEFLQVSTKTIRRWISSGDLVAHRIGRQFRISESDLQMFIKMRRG
jgi:excisionase family DNA binding protein